LVILFADWCSSCEAFRGFFNAFITATVVGRHTILEHYLFKFRGDMLLCLGVGSLFNHSRRPSLDYRVDRQDLIIRFYAAREISVRLAFRPA
jgi:hypothetical protein